MPLERVTYSGFPLLRGPDDWSNGRNDYKYTTVAECQYLCYITEKCLYFNWLPRDMSSTPPEGLGVCWLKYGMGKKDMANGINPSNNRFGHRNTAGLIDKPPR